MYPVTYVIWGRDPDGTERPLFNWTRGVVSGLDRAVADARRHGQVYSDFWAVPAVEDGSVVRIHRHDAGERTSYEEMDRLESLYPGAISIEEVRMTGGWLVAHCVVLA